MGTCGLWTSNYSFTWELVRNAESQAPPGPTESESTFNWVKVWEALVDIKLLWSVILSIGMRGSKFTLGHSGDSLLSRVCSVPES